MRIWVRRVPTTNHPHHPLSWDIPPNLNPQLHIAMSLFTGFRRVNVTNPNTGETKEKIQVVHKDGHVYTLLTDLTPEAIKAERDKVLGKIDLREGEFGTYAVITKAEILEEF